MTYTIGETVLDIIVNSIDDVHIRPGGSLLNTAISLGRLGTPVSHISMIANDKASDMLKLFLHSNGVTTNYLNRENRIKTSLALAFLDENKNANYSFYKEELQEPSNLYFPETTDSDIVHFGSYFSLNPLIHKQLHQFLHTARKNQSILLYDPNFRKPHLPDLKKLKPLIESNLRVAHIVKASNDDLANIFGVCTPEEAWNVIKKYQIEVFIYTMGDQGAWVFTTSGNCFVPSKKITVVSTIGAGDTFSAGIIFYLYNKIKQDLKFSQFGINNWKICLGLATEFAAETCQSYDNYLSRELANKYKDV